MRSFDLAGLEAWRPFIYYLTQALASLNARSTVVFRGLKLRDFTGAYPGRNPTELFLDGCLFAKPGEEDESAKYHPGNIVLWPAFSSTTRDFTIAMEYGTSGLRPGESAVVLKIHTQTVKPIKEFSYFQYEEELLYKANSTFRVTGLWQATSFNLRQGVKLSSASELFAIPTEHLAQRMLSLDEARRTRTLLITLVEQAVDAPILDAAAHVQEQRRRTAHQGHEQALAVAAVMQPGEGVPATEAAPPPSVPPPPVPPPSTTTTVPTAPPPPPTVPPTLSAGAAAEPHTPSGAVPIIEEALSAALTAALTSGATDLVAFMSEYLERHLRGGSGSSPRSSAGAADVVIDESGMERAHAAIEAALQVVPGGVHSYGARGDYAAVELVRFLAAHMRLQSLQLPSLGEGGEQPR